MITLSRPRGMQNGSTAHLAMHNLITPRKDVPDLIGRFFDSESATKSEPLASEELAATRCGSHLGAVRGLAAPGPRQLIDAGGP